MELEYQAIANALKEVNALDFRAKLDKLSGKCSSCDRPRIHTTLQKIFDQAENDCHACTNELDDQALTLMRFWELMGAPREELRVMLMSRKLQISLQRMMGVIGKWGLHYPLILPTTVKWEVTNRCNLKCRHCLVDAGVQLDNELSTVEALGLVDQCSSTGVRNLGILGGEPLLRRDLFTIIDYANSKGMDVSLSTNAIVIDKELAGKLADVKLRDIAISIDGIGDVHDQFRGVRGAFEKTVWGTKNLTSLGIEFTISTLVSKHNIHQVGDVIDLAAELGAAKFAANDLQPTGRAQELRDWCLSQEEFDLLGQIVDQKQTQYGARIKLAWVGVGNNPGVPDGERGPLMTSKCGAGLTELTVGADGTVRACPFSSATTENIRERSLEEIWFDSDQIAVYQDRVKLKGRCGRCKLKYSCGGCRARAESFINDPLGPDIRCRLEYAL